MLISRSLEPIPLIGKPAVVTIGNFDGLHLGHRKVLDTVKEEAGKIKGCSVVITFSNHPLEILKPAGPLSLVCTFAHKQKLLEEIGVDMLYALEFTKEFAAQDAETFLKSLRKVIPYRILILGHDAKLGKNQEGDREALQALSEKMGFEVIYLEPFHTQGVVVSSSQVRRSIRKGDFEEAERLLGRPYSILSTVVRGAGIGKRLGYPTANLDVAKLCLPPYGVYGVTARIDDTAVSGIANLGIAPTVHESNIPLLEIYLFEEVGDLYGREVEVFFRRFIRPEITFDSVDALKDQIAKDIITAKNNIIKYAKRQMQ